MNKEIIKAALVSGILRKYDMSKAEVGDKVLGWEPGEVLAVYGSNVVIGWDLDDGKSADIYLTNQDHRVYLAPLCWVEDKPVYKGDTLYRTNEWGTCSVVAKELSEGGRSIMFEGNYDSDLDGSRSKLSWTDPTILFEVEGKPVRKGDVLYGTWCGNRHSGYEITGKDVDGRPMWCDVVVLTESLDHLTWTKPKASPLNINGHIVPAPEREPLPEYTEYFVPCLFDGKADNYEWVGDNVDNRFLNSGLIHLTEEAATAHSQALISLTKS